MNLPRWPTLVSLGIAGSATALLLIPWNPNPVPDALAGAPRIFLWAWERPEDLRFLPADVGVALLAGTLTVRDSSIDLRPRMQSLSLPEASLPIAVIRVEAESAAPASLPESLAPAAAGAVLSLIQGREVAALQIDFDATVSQRPFYRQMLEGIRHGLPPGLPLSITALASWCAGDPWIEDLPIDEAVPMLFQMGPDGMDVDRLLARGGDFGPDVCRHSLGISTDEPLRSAPRGRRTYIFHPRRWTAASAESAISGAKQWQP